MAFDPDEFDGLRLHCPGFGVIGAKFMPQQCACGYASVRTVAPKKWQVLDARVAGARRPESGDLEHCPECRAVRVWKNGKWRTAGDHDLRRRLLPNVPLMASLRQ
jgi:hypothetical protein